MQIIEETPGAGQTSDSDLPVVLMCWPWETCTLNPCLLQTWTRTLAPSGPSPSHWAGGGVRCTWEIWWDDFSGKQRELPIVNSANIYQTDTFPATAAMWFLSSAAPASLVHPHIRGGRRHFRQSGFQDDDLRFLLTSQGPTPDLCHV